MKLNKIMLGAIVALGTISMANAANHGGGNAGGGTVTFKGTIVEAPCSIDPGSLDQTVKLGDISANQLADGGKSTPQDILVKLTGCDVKTAENVTTTFNGAESSAQPGLLAILGTASGASISINDTDGKLLPLGEKSRPQKIVGGQATLRFSAHLQGDGASAAVTPGEFNSVADFTLAYQ